MAITTKKADDDLCKSETYVEIFGLHIDITLKLHEFPILFFCRTGSTVENAVPRFWVLSCPVESLVLKIIREFYCVQPILIQNLEYESGRAY